MWLKYAARYVLSFGLLALVLMQMNWDLLTSATISAHWRPFFLSVIFVLGQVFFLNLRWHCYLNVGREKIPFRTSVLINIAGYFANIFFLTSVGGIVAKSALAVRYGVSVVHAVFATFLDRFMTLAALIVFSAIGLPFLQNVIDAEILYILLATTLVFIISVVAFLLCLRSGLLRDFILSSRRRSRVVATLRQFTENYEMMSKTGVYSLCAQLCFILSVYVLADDLSVAHVDAVTFLSLIPILALIASLPLGFGGWGIREGAFVYGLPLIGFSMEQAFLLSVQVGLVGLIVPFIVGLPYLVQDDLRISLANILASPSRKRA